VIDSDFYFTVTICALFLFYGFSNLYIIMYLRKKENYVVGLIEFITIFMGNIKNYINLNKRFRKWVVLDGDNIFFNRTISIMHLFSPVLIPLFILYWVVTIGLY